MSHDFSIVCPRCGAKQSCSSRPSKPVQLCIPCENELATSKQKKFQTDIKTVLSHKDNRQALDTLTNKKKIPERKTTLDMNQADRIIEEKKRRGRRRSKLY